MHLFLIHTKSILYNFANYNLERCWTLIYDNLMIIGMNLFLMFVFFIIISDYFIYVLVVSAFTIVFHRIILYQPIDQSV